MQWFPGLKVLFQMFDWCLWSLAGHFGAGLCGVGWAFGNDQSIDWVWCLGWIFAIFCWSSFVQIVWVESLLSRNRWANRLVVWNLDFLLVCWLATFVASRCWSICSGCSPMETICATNRLDLKTTGIFTVDEKKPVEFVCRLKMFKGDMQNPSQPIADICRPYWATDFRYLCMSIVGWPRLKTKSGENRPKIWASVTTFKNGSVLRACTTTGSVTKTPSSKDSCGNTCVHYAAGYGHPELPPGMFKKHTKFWRANLVTRVVGVCYTCFIVF